MTKIRSVSMAVLSLLIALLITACGGDDSSNGTADESSEQAAPVRLGIAVYSPYYWAFYAAEQEGFYEEENLDVETTVIDSSPALVAAAQAGDIDVFPAATDTVVGAISEGADLSIIAGVEKVSVLEFMAPEGTESAEELEGSTIGATNLTSSDALYAQLLLKKQAGLEPKTDYDIVAVGTMPARAAAMANGEIQGAVLALPYSGALKDKGFVSLGGADEAVGEDFNFINLTARNGFLESQPDVAVRFLRAYFKGLEFLYDPANRAEAIDLLVSEPVNISPEDARVSYSAYLRGDTVKNTAQIGLDDVQIGATLAKQLTFPDISTEPAQYADLSFLEEAGGVPEPGDAAGAG